MDEESRTEFIAIESLIALSTVELIYLNSHQYQQHCELNIFCFYFFAYLRHHATKIRKIQTPLPTKIFKKHTQLTKKHNI